MQALFWLEWVCADVRASTAKLIREHQGKTPTQANGRLAWATHRSLGIVESVDTTECPCLLPRCRSYPRPAELLFPSARWASESPPHRLWLLRPGRSVRGD